jgi:hypothetical protein
MTATLYLGRILYIGHDDETNFRLWRFRINAFAHQQVIEVEPIGKAPNGAEGLAIWGNVAVVLMDGSELSEPPASLTAPRTEISASGTPLTRS